MKDGGGGVWHLQEQGHEQACHKEKQKTRETCPWSTASHASQVKGCVWVGAERKRECAWSDKNEGKGGGGGKQHAALLGQRGKGGALGVRQFGVARRGLYLRPNNLSKCNQFILSVQSSIDKY